MVSARLNSKPQLRAKERGTKLGDQLFHRVGFGTKAPGQSQTKR